MLKVFSTAVHHRQRAMDGYLYRPPVSNWDLGTSPGIRSCCADRFAARSRFERLFGCGNREVILQEIDGFVFQQRRSDGYWNATAMCQAAGKQLCHYTENDKSRKFKQVLSGSLGTPIGLLSTVQMTEPNSERGTWVHPRVAINLAQWCSPEFDVAVSGWVEELVNTGKVELVPPQAPSFDLKSRSGLAQLSSYLAAELDGALEVNQQLRL